MPPRVSDGLLSVELPRLPLGEGRAFGESGLIRGPASHQVYGDAVRVAPPARLVPPVGEAVPSLAAHGRGRRQVLVARSQPRAVVPQGPRRRVAVAPRGVGAGVVDGPSLAPTRRSDAVAVAARGGCEPEHGSAGEAARGTTGERSRARGVWIP